LSSTGACFDIGTTTRAALAAFERTGEPYCGSADPRAAGNGSIMRLAPVPLYYAGRPEEAIQKAADSSRTTHGAPVAVDACRYLAGLIVGALRGASKEELTARVFHHRSRTLEARRRFAWRSRDCSSSFRRRNPPAIRGTGYVVQTLEAALWAFHRTDDFRTGCLRVVNLGDDADTTGAVFGQIAGAYYGEHGIPSDWRARLHAHDLIASLADRLCRTA
jgi:ADP-ribosylglycohydrolase